MTEKNKYHIIWQHWKPPFEDEYGVVNQMNLPPGIVEIKTFQDIDILNEEEEHNEKDDKRFIRALATPMGMFPINENYNPFNFWIGHTNFMLTSFVGNIIESYPGVESFNVLTPYRFKIAIGKAFVSGEVKSGLQNKVYDFCNKLDAVLKQKPIVIKEQVNDIGDSIE